MADSIFTQIIQGTLPSHKIYEDEYSYALLDIYPIQPGHVLVVPKRQVSFIWDLDPEEYRGLMTTVHKIGRRLREVFPEAARVGVIVEGLDVADHAHVKVFPFSNEQQFRHLPPKSKPDHQALAALAKQIAEGV